MVRVPTPDKGRSLLPTPAVLHPEVLTVKWTEMSGKLGLSRRVSRPLHAAQPVLLSLLGAVSPPHWCFPRVRVYYFNYFIETAPTALRFCTPALSVSLGPVSSSVPYQPTYLDEIHGGIRLAPSPMRPELHVTPGAHTSFCHTSGSLGGWVFAFLTAPPLLGIWTTFHFWLLEIVQ